MVTDIRGRFMGCRIALLIAVAGLTVASCGSDLSGTRGSVSTSPDPSQFVTPPTGDTASAFDPKAACQAAVPAGYHYFNLQATTVGDVRAFAAGPLTTDGVPPVLWPNAFPDAPPTAPAAWCTGVDGGETYVYYVVSRNQPLFVIGTEVGIDPPQPGPPHIE